MKRSNKTKWFAGVVLVGLCGGMASGSILYQETFDDEMLGSTSLNDGTTPEINVGDEDRDLQSTGTAQGAAFLSGTNIAWSTKTRPGLVTGCAGLRFGGTSYNWAKGLNSKAILDAGGFSISFDWHEINAAPDDWFAVRVGNGGENAAVTDANVDFAFLLEADGTVQTFDNAQKDVFESTHAPAVNRVRLDYKFESWTTGSTVAFTALVDGAVVATDTFAWDASDDVKIVFGTRYDGGLVDNIIIRTLR